MKIVRNMLLIVCGIGAILLAVLFFSRPQQIEASMPLLSEQIVKENEAKAQEELQKQQAAEAARKRAELEQRMYRCKEDDECIIVDKDPCGCLKGPKGVVAINSSYSLDFSNLMTKKFASMEICPDNASTEKECSPSARPVCQANRCKIVY